VIGEAELLGLATTVGLELGDERIPGILENFRRMAQVAQAVNGIALAPQDEPGPEWKP
jgi:hypothetical protein